MRNAAEGASPATPRFTLPNKSESVGPIAITVHIGFKLFQIEDINVASQTAVVMLPKAPPAISRYALSGVIVLPIAAIILRAGLSSNIECVGLSAHCPYNSTSKWMMLTAALAIAADIGLVLNLLIKRARAWLDERPDD